MALLHRQLGMGARHRSVSGSNYRQIIPARLKVRQRDASGERIGVILVYPPSVADNEAKPAAQTVLSKDGQTIATLQPETPPADQVAAIIIRADGKSKEAGRAS